MEQNNLIIALLSWWDSLTPEERELTGVEYSAEDGSDALDGMGDNADTNI